MKVTYKGIVLADSEKTEVVEGNQYFPPDSIETKYFTKSKTHSTCPWKGEASYYNLEIDGETTKDVAWYYPDPKPAASNIKDYVAFYKNKVTVSQETK